MPTIVTVERLRNCLLALERSTDVPRLDIEWLRLRCDDTLGFEGQMRRSPQRQLQKDVAQIVARFPDLIPRFLLDEMSQIDE